MAKRGKRNSLTTATRLIRLMQMIPRHSNSARGRIGAPELQRKLAEEGYRTSLRTIQRDLKQLQDAFPVLQNDGVRDQLGWFWGGNDALLDIPPMDAPGAMAFKLVERYMAWVAPGVVDTLTPYLKTADRSLAAHADDWLDRVAIVPRSMPLRPAAVDGEIARTVQLGLLERRRIRIRYRPRSGEVAEYELSPQGLVIRHEVSYLVATAWDYTDLRHYALHRMEAGTVHLLDEPANEIEDFDLQRYIDEGAFQYRVAPDPVHLVLRVQQQVALHLKETPLSPEQHMEPADETNEWMVVYATVPDTLQLRWWLLGLGEQVVVERPTGLRAEIEDTLQSSLSNYASGDTGTKSASGGKYPSVTT